jgi:hypothetical protein
MPREEDPVEVKVEQNRPDAKPGRFSRDFVTDAGLAARAHNRLFGEWHWGLGGELGVS